MVIDIACLKYGMDQRVSWSDLQVGELVSMDGSLASMSITSQLCLGSGTGPDELSIATIPGRPPGSLKPLARVKLSFPRNTA